MSHNTQRREENQLFRQLKEVKDHITVVFANQSVVEHTSFHNHAEHLYEVTGIKTLLILLQNRDKCFYIAFTMLLKTSLN